MIASFHHVLCGKTKLHEMPVHVVSYYKHSGKIASGSTCSLRVNAEVETERRTMPNA